MIEPVLNVEYHVVAYDASGYGENCNRSGFKSGQEAIDYAKSLEARFKAVVWKRITMEPISIAIPF